MSTDQERIPATRKRVPTPRQRYLAATIRIDADKQLKRDTPEWIIKIADEGKHRFAS